MNIKVEIVFTVKSVINREKLVLYVVHGQNDEWQFLSNEEVSMQDMMMVSL